MATLRYLTLRALRNTPGELWRRLRGRATVAIVADGVPRALVIGVDEDGLEETLRVVAWARAQLALSRLRQRAAERGVDRLPAEVIDKEIAVVRRARAR